ncbi:MAG: hypothetical protein JWQ03_3101 [Variovorax sp.]|nr:hypothetical protein [Variovorax sp.]
MILYRFTLFGRPAGEWRQRKVEAQQDVVDAREATVDDSGSVFWSVGVEIEEVDAPGPPLPDTMRIARGKLRPVPLKAAKRPKKRRRMV